MSDRRDEGLAARLDLRATSGAPRASAAPRAQSRFQPVRDRYGWRLALVFANHASGGVCPYYAAQRCFHCDIGAGEGAAADHTTNRERLAWFRQHDGSSLARTNHLVLFNSGSVLNPRELPIELLDEIVAFARSLPAIRVLSLDSREAFIRPAPLRRILSVVGDAISVRPILGLESADDRIRNDILQKQMPRSAIARVFKDLAALTAELGHGRLGLDVNIVIAGPGTTEETAVDDAVSTARFALTSGAEHGVNVDLNLHPYYVGDRGMARFPRHPRCSLETTVRAASKIVDVVRSMAAECALFIGSYDEGHDRERQRPDLELDRARAAFEQFNETNDPGALERLVQFGPDPQGHQPVLYCAPGEAILE